MPIPCLKLDSNRGLVALAALGAALLMAAPASAQTRAALVRSVDEPARVPYAYSLLPTCSFTNQCVVNFPVVPAGKRLRVTNVQVIAYSAPTSGFVSINRHGAGASDAPVLAFPVTSFSGAYYGAFISMNQVVDLIFEAGDSMMLELGTTAANTFQADSRNRFGVTGYLVDTTP